MIASCQRCGSERDADGSCTVCLLAAALDLPDPDEETQALETPAAEGGTADHDSFEPYHVLRTLGEGGMGVVYLAEQIDPLPRQVALKVIKFGLNSGDVLSRFNYERQALARMEHPNIARVYDAGASRNGRPFFVMEYVDGVAITLFCDRHSLAIKDRLQLFVAVCQAIQHAHQKGVIHRDIKPSNILVAEIEGKPVPKIIDFGIARATEPQASPELARTQFGHFLGTPGHMSPEQADPAAGDVDTSSDVYSLGIVLYELLAGATPFGEKMRNAGVSELLRIIRQEEAVPMAATFARLGDGGSEVARLRGTDLSTLRRQLRGDLNSIVMRAIEKDRRRRYSTAAELSADIQRYLRDEPVLASPPGLLYRAGKFARRHRWGLATACAFILVLIAATVVSVRQSLRANREAAVAQAVNDFLQNDLLAQASASNQARPSARPDPDLKVRTALDRASARIGGKFERQPEVEASIRDTMGQTYLDLGLYNEARDQFERARELHQRVLGESDPRTVKTMSRLGRADVLSGRYAEAQQVLSRAVEIGRRALGDAHPDTLDCMTNLAVCYRLQGQYGQAETLQTQAFDIMRRVLGPENPETLRAMNSLGNIDSALGKYEQAETLDRQILEVRRRLLGPESPEVLYSMMNLAADFQAEGRYGEAEQLLSQTFASDRGLLGLEHSATLHTMNMLASAYYMLGKYPQAEALHRQTLEILRRVQGPRHIDSLMVATNLADDFSAQGKFTEAEGLFRDTLETEARALAPNHPVIFATRSEFARMYQRWGKYALAESNAAQALEGRRRALGSQHPDTMQSTADLALADLSQGKYVQAEGLAREAFAANQKYRPEDWRRFRAESLLGKSDAGEKKYAEAEPLLLEAYQGMTARKDYIGAPDEYHADCAAAWIFELYRDWGKPDKAAAWSKLHSAGSGSCGAH